MNGYADSFHAGQVWISPKGNNDIRKKSIYVWRERLARMGDRVEMFYLEGFEAKKQGLSINDCPYSSCDPLEFCTWRGGWWDAASVTALLFDETNTACSYHALSLRSFA